MTNNDLYDKALKAIMDLFGDKSVTLTDCLQNLETLKDEIETLIDVVENDIEI